MKPETVICIYPVKKGDEMKFEGLLEKHWPTLHKAGLILDEPAQIFRRKDKKTGETTYVEIFTWKDEKASGEAHHLPEIQAIWEPMGLSIREENGRPAWSFDHYERVKPTYFRT